MLSIFWWFCFICRWIDFHNRNFSILTLFMYSNLFFYVFSSLYIMFCIDVNSSTILCYCRFSIALVITFLGLIKIMFNKWKAICLQYMTCPLQITIPWIASHILRFTKKRFLCWENLLWFVSKHGLLLTCLCQVLVTFLQKGEINIFVKIVVFFHINNNMLTHSFFTKIILLRLSKFSWEDFLQPVFYPEYMIIL